MAQLATGPLIQIGSNDIPTPQKLSNNGQPFLTLDTRQGRAMSYDFPAEGGKVSARPVYSAAALPEILDFSKVYAQTIQSC
jgi:hypothetical protein